MKQQSLLSFFSSSPPPSPSGVNVSPPMRKTSTSSSDSDQVQDTDSDRVGAIRFEPEAVEISEDDSPRRPKKRNSHAIPVRATNNESESPEETMAPRYSKQKGKKRIVLDSDDDSETRPRKRKLIKGIRPPTPDDDDGDDILDTENLVETRLRSRGKVTAFQKNLERLKILKGKKRGQVVLESSSEAEQSESSEGVPFKGAKPHHSGDSDGETDSSEDEDESFIVPDEEPVTQLPPAFSLSSHQDLTHHFKIVCQLFVHLAVQPLADRRTFFERALKEEQYLSVPLQVTRRKLSGLRDSLVASSVWRSEFKQALETYPTFTLIRLEFAIPECDACRLGGRQSTLLGRLSGRRYDEYDFEDLSDDESDECTEDEGEESERDVKAEFHFGRFCAARTQVYHQFSHWEYSLYKSLEWEILQARDENRHFVRVAYSDGIKPPRDVHDADKMMEWLDQRGIIEMEWQKVREMMDKARNLEIRGSTDLF